jgi:MFS family permease
MDPSISPDGKPLKWYQGLPRYCWVVLAVAALGWLFDTMDQNLYTLIRQSSLEDLLRPHPGELSPLEKKELSAHAKDIGGTINAIFLIGWAIGGFAFGILGDRMGRTKTMITTILIYAVFTGLSGLAQSWPAYAGARFLTGLGVGGEWAAGASLVAETFPQRSRPMALGLLQALSAIGNMLAAVITFGIHGDVRWRWVYFIGIVPAFLVVWIQTGVKEPDTWLKAKERASLGREMGSIAQIFGHPTLRRNTIAGILMAIAGQAALWGIAFFSTDVVREQLIRSGMSADDAGQLKTVMFFVQNLGSFFGIYVFALLAERFNRRKAFMGSFAAAWLSVLVFFWGVPFAGKSVSLVAPVLAFVMGFCTLMPFSGYTMYFPELYPTRLRATGCGFLYNAARIFAAAAPFALGRMSAWLTKTYSDAPERAYPLAATIVSFIYLLGFVGTAMGPETKGKPLPEDADFETPPAAAISPEPPQAPPSPRTAP